MAGPLYKNIADKTTKPEHKVIRFLKVRTLKGFEGQSIYSVSKQFLKGLFKENLNIRAYSLSYNFFLALFPTIIFFFTLIGYIPIKKFKAQFIADMGKFMPQSTYNDFIGTINDILHNQHGGLLSFGFFLAIFFASNGFHSLINTFNRRLPIKAKRNWFHNRGRALLLTFLLAFIVIVWSLISYYFGYLESWTIKKKILSRDFASTFFMLINFLFSTAIVFVSISSIYRLAPANVQKWKFVTAGSVLATALSLISTWGFKTYVNHFDSYNKIYGSIGAIIVLLLLIYINTLSVIVGFELNASIDHAKLKNKAL